MRKIKRAIIFILAVMMILQTAAIGAMAMSSGDEVSFHDFDLMQRYEEWEREILFDDFNNYTASSTSPSVPTGYWGAGTYAETKDAAHGASVRVPKSKWFGTAQYNFMNGYETESKIKFEFEITVDSKCNFQVQLLENAVGTTSANFSTNLQFKTDGTFGIANVTNTSNYNAIKNYEIGHWYQIEYIVDYDRQVYYLHIDGQEIVNGSKLATTQYDFRHLRFTNASATNTTDSGYVDNLRITQFEKETDVLTNVDFESYAATKEAPAFPTTNGLRGSMHNNKMFAVDAGGTHGKVLAVHNYTPDGNAPWIATALKGTTNGTRSNGRWMFEFDYCPQSIQKMVILSGDSNSVSTTLVDFTSLGSISVLNANKPLNVIQYASYTPREWYNIRVIADAAKSIYSVYINNLILAEDVPFPTTMTHLTGLRAIFYNYASLGTSEATPTVYYVDNIKVAKLKSIGKFTAKENFDTQTEGNTITSTGWSITDSFDGSYAQASSMTGKKGDTTMAAKLFGTEEEVASLASQPVNLAKNKMFIGFDFKPQADNSALLKFGSSNILSVVNGSIVFLPDTANSFNIGSISDAWYETKVLFAVRSETVYAQLFFSDVAMTDMLPTDIANTTDLFVLLAGETGEAYVYYDNLFIKEIGRKHIEIVKTGFINQGAYLKYVISGTIKAGISILNYDETNSPYTVTSVLAAYNNDKMTAVGVARETVNGGLCVSVAPSIAADLQNVTEIKSYTFEDLTNLKPVYLTNSLYAEVYDVPQQLSLPSVFASNSVMQRDMVLPVWGSALPLTEISVTLDNKTYQTVSDQYGEWMVEADAITLREEPYTLSVTDGTTNINYDNILAGDVYLCSGQSNMEWKLYSSSNGPAEVANADNNNIRLFTQNKTGSFEEEKDNINGKWNISSPATTTNFSAVGYLFAKEIQNDLNVPVGLIAAYYGGSRGEAWISQSALAASPIAHRISAGTAPNKASMLFNAMVAPIIPYGIKGVLWYQGEANSGLHSEYLALQKTLLDDWRGRWGYEFPFIYAQISAYGGSSNYQYVREAQLQLLAEKSNTAMAVTMDVGNETDIHPTDKATVAHRMALAAKGMVYNQNVAYKFPQPVSYVVKGNTVEITFQDTYDGLSAQGAVTAFELCGEDDVYYPATAQIISKNIISISCDSVTSPKGVYYGFRQYPNPVMNLYNSAGLLATPFRLSVQ